MLRETVPLLAFVKAYAVQPCGQSTLKRRESVAESQLVLASSLCERMCFQSYQLYQPLACDRGGTHGSHFHSWPLQQDLNDV